MIQIDLPTLVKRLNLFSRQALDMAIRIHSCRRTRGPAGAELRTHFNFGLIGYPSQYRREVIIALAVKIGKTIIRVHG